MASSVWLLTSPPPLLAVFRLLRIAELCDEKLHITVLDAVSVEATPLGPPTII
jgi:hypothetical protein